MKNYKKTICVILLGAAVIVTLAGQVSPAHANTIIDQMKDSISKVQLPNGGPNPDAAAQAIVGKVISAILGMFGIVFLGLMIYGGYHWMMASGRDEEVKKAKDIIRAAIIGLVIVMSAYALAYFVTSAIQTATK